MELLLSLGLLLPAFNKRLALLAPLAAGCIAAEMLIFTVLNILSAAPDSGQIVYWLIVAALCAFIVYGRTVRNPVR